MKFLILLLIPVALHAKFDLKPQWRSLEIEEKNLIPGKETYVVSNGLLYKQLEVDGKIFLLEMKNPAVTNKDEDLNCTSAASRIDDVRLIKASTKAVSLPSVYVEFLRKKCVNRDPGNEHLALEADPRIGINLSKDKKQSMWWAPITNMLGYSSDF